MRKLNIACVNAKGKLRQEAIDSILYYCKNVDLLFITETWLPPDKTIPTHWQQFHIYGEPVVNADRCQMGISLFINPSFNYSKLHVDTQISKYYMTCHLDNLKIHCVYLPPSPSLDNTTSMQILESIPLTPDTILCGDFNAHMGKRTGDSRWNPRGNKLSSFLDRHTLINYNSLLQYAKPTRVVYKESTNITEASIADYFISQSTLMHSKLDIRTDLSVLRSDHKLMVFSFIWMNHDVRDDTPPEPLRKRWKLSRLAEMPVRTAYITTMQQQFHSKNLNYNTHQFADFLAQTHSSHSSNPDIKAHADTIEYLCSQFYDSIYYALDTILTSASPRPKT
ncbi:Endonuclease/exonuclease/phosphatase [Choanephora cucurbitarum]|nr:Endonuclease/exonuclease/phosphatase [Choanephora cucurbitarum]